MSAPKKVVLAYSGGLDTSIILKWLQTEYGCEVVTFTADLGQGEELEPARAKAELMGASSIYIEDVREEFVRDFVFPMFRANALYEGLYLLGTSIARPLISKRLVEIAQLEGADAVAHGATGKGNDQVRFELTAAALREAEEEIGLPRDQVEVLGCLPSHETVTNFMVTPVIGLIHGQFAPKPEAGEVAEVFAVPFSHVTDPANFKVEGRRWKGRRRHYFVVPYGPYYIWGATARILRSLADRMA